MNMKLASDPHLRRWMLFVDGENFTMRGQDYAANNAISLREGEWYSPNAYLWLPGWRGTAAITNSENSPHKVQDHAIRAFYYTALLGDDVKLNTTRHSLHKHGFTPRVFKKNRGRGAKGVDIALTTDVLSHAFRGNFEVAVIVAGDEDYVPLVEEVKRLGKVVYIAFFLGGKNGMSEALRLASDDHFEIAASFNEAWSTEG